MQSGVNYIPQTDPKGKSSLYRWKQTFRSPGQKSELNEGYFLFDNLDGKIVLASVSTLAPAELEGSCSLVEILPGNAMRWRFGGMTVEGVVKNNNNLAGNCLFNEGLLYSWEAVPVTSISDDFSSSLLAISVPELIGFLPKEESKESKKSKGRFSYRPLNKESVRNYEFRNLKDLVHSLYINR